MSENNDKKLDIEELENTSGGYVVSGPTNPGAVGYVTYDHWIAVPRTNLCNSPLYSPRCFIGALFQFDALQIVGAPVRGSDGIEYVPVRVPKYSFKFGYVIRTQITPLV